MGNIINSSTFGSYINTYERTSGTAQESVTQIITDDINDGASMVTFLDTQVLQEQILILQIYKTASTLYFTVLDVIQVIYIQQQLEDKAKNSS
ncbi:MAG: hypothetical protein R2771_06915 [Saprospiraceae bacterium]